MKNNNFIISSLFALILIATLVIGCEDNNYPESIYDPNDDGKPTPVITSVEPSLGKVFAGIDTVWINGSNFSNVIEDNSVFFSGEPAEIISATETQLIVIAPPISGSSILIQVSVTGAFNFAEFKDYALFESIVEVISFGEGIQAFALAMDRADTLFISVTKPKEVIVKISPEGEEILTLDLEYSPWTLVKASGLKWGPDGALYYVNILRNLFVVPPGGGEGIVFTPNPAGFPDGVFDLDFDQNDVIFATGVGSAIYSMKLDGTVNTSYTYDDVAFKSIKVFDGFVYVAGIYVGSDDSVVQEGIWKHEILNADGTLGNSILVFDWESEFGATNARLITMAIAADGEIYVSSDVGHAITVIHTDGSTEPLYPAVMPYQINNLTWGSGDFLFATRWDLEEGKSQILKIDMRKPGAPYYGRQ